MLYFYGMRLRGCSIGCQPKEGVIKREETHREKYYDIIIYDRPLTKEEVKHYSLTPLYGYQYTDNLGEEFYHSFDCLDDCMRDARGTLEFAYDEYCALYPDADVTWTNKQFDCGSTSEAYVPGSDSYTKIEIFSPKSVTENAVFDTEEEAIECASSELGKHDSAIVTVEGKKTFLTSTGLPIEDRLRSPIETIVKEFLKEMTYDESMLDDTVNLIGAEMCEALIDKLEKHADVKVVSAYLNY